MEILCKTLSARGVARRWLALQRALAVRSMTLATRQVQ